MLTLLENLKHQMNQQSAVINLLMSRLNAEREPPSEMPDDISFPLSSQAEVDCFEEWLNDPANTMKKKQMVYILQTPHNSLYQESFLFTEHIQPNLISKGLDQ